MNLLANASTNYILEASLDSLHAESILWKNDLAFWRDELVFFYKLLKRKASVSTFPPVDMARAEKELISINAEKILKLSEWVEVHEKQLAVVFKSSSADDEHIYRNTHRKLLIDMVTLDDELKDYKRKLFRFVEENES